MQSGKPLLTDKKLALEKASSYCAYQERSQQEVRNKLYELGVPSGLREEIIAELIGQGFLNEERFARAYAGGKFRMKGWGKQKIRKALEAKGVSEYCIRAGLEEIGEQAYLDKLKALLREKLDKSGKAAPFVRRQKAAAYAFSRGYESELIWAMLREMEED